MRILDKNTDFYDYLQNMYPDNTFTFDRTDSFLLTKEIMCNHLFIRRTYSHFSRPKDRKYHNFALLQICNTFWLFLITITSISDYERPTDYEIELLAKWKNFNKPRAKYCLDTISFGYDINNQISGDFWSKGYDVKRLKEKVDILIQAVDTNNYKLQNHINKHTVFHGDNVKTEKHIPLLKACGIANCIEALDVFLALEEYFSLEKSSSERTDAIGMTNNDKIESHGFDVKTSFRGKR